MIVEKLTRRRRVIVLLRIPQCGLFEKKEPMAWQYSVVPASFADRILAVDVCTRQETGAKIKANKFSAPGSWFCQ